MKKGKQAVLKAWLDPGVKPGDFVDAKRKLKKEWPALANALDELVRD